MNHKSMRKGEIEKARWELEAAQVFARWYSDHFDMKLQVLRQNKPSKPDLTCALEEERVDIEIAHLYGSEKEAMQILGRELDDNTRCVLQQLARSGDLEHRLLLSLNRILQQKSLKHYESHRVWLVIRNAHPAWSCINIKKHINELAISREHPFEQIWAIGDLDAKSGALLLYPRSKQCQKS